MFFNQFTAEQYKRADRVYFNSKIAFNNINVFGMDMDDTVIQYTSELENLRYNLVARNLIESNKGYSFLLDNQFQSDAFIRGLVIDSMHGTVLKINSRKQVDQARRGFEEIDSKEKSLYYKRPLNLEEKIGNDKRYCFIDSRYYAVDAFLYSSMIQNLDSKIKIDDTNANVSIFQEIRKATERIYQDNSFLSTVMQDFSKYVIRILPDFDYSERVIVTLKKMKNANKKIFLITNSPEKYTNSVMSYFIGEDYHNYFDEIIVSSRKPGFFSSNDDFKKGQYNKIKIGGSHNKLLDSNSISRSADIIYIGDHIKGDIISGQRKQGIIPAAIVPELLLDVATRSKQDNLSSKINSHESKIESLRNVVLDLSNDSTNNSAIFILKNHIAELKSQVTTNKRTRLEILNPHWGSPFKTGSDEFTFWAYQIENFAGMYMALLSSMLKLDFEKKLGPEQRRKMAHEY